MPQGKVQQSSFVIVYEYINPENPDNLTNSNIAHLALWSEQDWVDEDGEEFTLYMEVRDYSEGETLEAIFEPEEGEVFENGETLSVSGIVDKEGIITVNQFVFKYRQ